ncbi:unnamed protein product [Tilletia laevis]|uniref:Uncharacterized protein n=2 Tax=Tilletia TaxID=13289 RepID=A0A9N8LQ04_9BASI|nr:unnamed protein product [Tilletia caries]CAD6914551.1 unnamed protein product [Tilletia controversa]CAD6932706.1 unnamed protein product [Tilletia laevis]CAD6924650.1 unnamed protein product [Tilletia caries]CAD6956870.1 unnamed protein product [Tilletia controversa]
MVQLGQLRQASGVEDDDVDDNSEADDAEELIYPNSYKDDAASVITRLAPSSGLQTPNGPLLRACDPRPRRLLCVRLRAERDALGSGDELRPRSGLRTWLRHDAPNRHVMASNRAPVLREQMLSPQWESDSAAMDCRGCSRRFMFFLRKVRESTVFDFRFSRVNADTALEPSSFCSAPLPSMRSDPSVTHVRPTAPTSRPMSSSSTRAVPEMFLHPAVSAAQICNSCIAERQLIASLRSRFGGGGTGAEALLRNNGVRGMNDLNGGL